MTKSEIFFWHIASPRIQYTIKEHKQFKQNDFWNGGEVGTTFTMFNSNDYEIVLSIEAETFGEKHKPLSVFRYIKENIETENTEITE